MIVYLFMKPTQGVAFKILQDQLTRVTEAQDPGPGNPQNNRKDQVSKYGQKASRNTVFAYRSVLEWV